MNNSLAWGFPCFGGSPQDGDASLARQEVPSTPCEDQGRIGQSAWQERGPGPQFLEFNDGHDRHFRSFLPIAVRHDILRSRDFAVSLRNSTDTLCRRAAAQRLRDVNTASRMLPDEETSANADDLRSRQNAHDRQLFISQYCEGNKNEETKNLQLRRKLTKN